MLETHIPRINGFSTASLTSGFSRQTLRCGLLYYLQFSAYFRSLKNSDMKPLRYTFIFMRAGVCARPYSPLHSSETGNRFPRNLRLLNNRKQFQRHMSSHFMTCNNIFRLPYACEGGMRVEQYFGHVYEFCSARLLCRFPSFSFGVKIINS